MHNSILFSALPILASIFLLVALSGCLTIHTVNTHPNLNVPEQWYDCESSGSRPQGDKIMESEVAKYINKLEFKNKDCRLNLKKIHILVNCYNDKKCNVDKLAEYMGLVQKEIK